MDNVSIKITNHPAQARHPITKAPLFIDGVPVPLFPDEFAIRLDGTIVGYVGSEEASRPILLIVPEAKLTAPIVDEIKLEVFAEFGSDSQLNVTAVKPQTKKSKKKRR